MTQTQILQWLKSGAFCRAFGRAYSSPEVGALDNSLAEKSSDAGYFIYLGGFSELPSESNGADILFQEFFSKIQALKSQAPGIYENTPIHLSRREFLAALDELEKSFHPFAAGLSEKTFLEKRDFTLPKRESYSEIFAKIQNHIEQKTVEKMVPVQFSQTEKQPQLWDRLRWLRAILEEDSALYPYGFWTEEFGVMGASPEILFLRQGQKVISAAVAGTQAKLKNLPHNALLFDEKERHEHQLVINDIRESLESLGTVEIGETGVVEFPKLFHLVTPISLELKSPDISHSSLVECLHPTSALGIYPRQAGLQLLADLPEQRQRNLHGIPLVFTCRQGDLNSAIAIVTIRGIQWNSLGTKIGAGGGVVAESELDKEWAELNFKLNSIYYNLGLS